MRIKTGAIVLAFLTTVGTLLHWVGLPRLLVSEYSPRRAAYLVNPILLWTNVGSDILLTVSYAILFVGCILLVRRLRCFPLFCDHLLVIAAFMIFLFASVVTNLLRIVSVWWPLYQFSIVLKIVCALTIFPATLFFSLRAPALAASVGHLFNLFFTQQQGEKLRKSEEFLDRTNRLAGIGGWELDLLTQELTWSAETCRIQGAELGYKPTLAEGLSMYAPSARPTILSAVEVASSGGPGWDLELPVVRFDGRHIWARSVGAVEFKDGKAVRLSGALQDVTARVEAREALLQANERVSLATDSGEIGIWDWDIATGVLSCDAWMYRLHGKDPARVQTDGLWRDHLHPEDKARVEQALNDAVAGIKEYNTEFRLIWEDGSVHTLRGAARVTRNEHGQAMKMIGANWDVTESRKLLCQVAQEQELLRVTLHSIGDGVITTDARECVTWLNPVAERLTGWAATESIGRPLEEIFQTSATETSLLKGEGIQSQNDLIKPPKDGLFFARNGIGYCGESSAAPIRNTLGDLLGSVIVLRDVTEKRKLMAEAEKAAKLQLQLTLRDQFLSHVSHELRSPLTSIYSFSSIIADGLAGDTTLQQKEYLQIVLKNVVQLQSMIEDLLTVTRSREGKLCIEPESLVPADAILEAFQTLQGAATKKNIQMCLDGDDNLPLVYADPVRLRQVLIILLDNALKFTPAEGTISIQVRKKDSEFLLIQVMDTGCGIPVEKWTLIFERLYQVSETSSDTSQAGRTGLGLGLHIARNLVHGQGGNIWVNSVLNQGSVFSFTIPIYSGQDTQAVLETSLTQKRKADPTESGD